MIIINKKFFVTMNARYKNRMEPTALQKAQVVIIATNARMSNDELNRIFYSCISGNKIKHLIAVLVLLA